MYWKLLPHSHQVFIREGQARQERIYYRLLPYIEFFRLFYKYTTGKTFKFVQGNYHGMEKCHWT